MSDSSVQPFETRPATLDDADALAGLANACSIERTGKARLTAPYVRAVLSTPGVNLETDTLLALDSGTGVVGYALVQDAAPHTLIIMLADVDPEYRAQGIGSTLCDWGEERARRSAPLAPEGERIVIVQQRLSVFKAAF